MKKLLICGKGGCGKSTLAALLAQAMSRRGKQVLLVDADESNIGLYRMLGLDVPQPLMDSLGGKKGFRERSKAAGIGLGGPPPLFSETMSLASLPEACVARSEAIRVLSVGKIHHFGEGCACPMGQLFRLFFSSLNLDAEDLVIVDTAAGVEHFGRSLDGQCDHILCVVDPSYESIQMARRASAFAAEAGLPVSVVFNRVTPEVESELSEGLGDVPVIGRIPDRRDLFLNTLKGLALDTEVPEMEAACDELLAV